MSGSELLLPHQADTNRRIHEMSFIREEVIVDLSGIQSPQPVHIIPRPIIKIPRKEQR